MARPVRIRAPVARRRPGRALRQRMKSPEVYRLLREDIGPWAKGQGLKRAKAMLSYYRAHGGEHTVFWFQVSQGGWGDYPGSKFTVELKGYAYAANWLLSAQRPRAGLLM